MTYEARTECPQCAEPLRAPGDDVPDALEAMAYKLRLHRGCDLSSGPVVVTVEAVEL